MTVFVLTWILPTGLVRIIQNHVYVYEKISVFDAQIFSTGDLEGYKITNILDGNLKTWWTPRNRLKDNSEFKIDKINKFDSVGAIDIHPGSHYPDYPEYGDIFPKNNRIKKLELTFSDGSRQTLEAQDKDILQRIKIKPVKTSSIRVRILEVFPGSQWQDVCISEFHPVLVRRYFKPFRCNKTKIAKLMGCETNPIVP